MAILAWAMMGIALWHFTVFFEERLAGGIIGAFLASTFGALIFGFLVSGLDVPSRADTTIGTALESVPGSVIAIGLLYLAAQRGGRTGAAPARA